MGVVRMVFLDVDGVLTVLKQRQFTASGFSKLHSSLLLRLARVLLQWNAVIVLSSSWRLDSDLMRVLRQEWQSVVNQHIPIIGVTECVPILGEKTLDHVPVHDTEAASRRRSREVRLWIDAFRHANPDTTLYWAVIDDLDLNEQLMIEMNGGGSTRFIRTNPMRGFSQSNAENLASFFQSQRTNEDEVICEISSLRLGFAGSINDESLSTDMQIKDVVTPAEHSTTEDSVLDAAMAESIFVRCGASKTQAESVLSQEEDALVLLELLEIVGLLEMSHQDTVAKIWCKRTFDLVLRIATLFRGQQQQTLRRWLAEYVAREEIVSIGSLEAYASVITYAQPKGEVANYVNRIEMFEELEQFVDQ